MNIRVISGRFGGRLLDAPHADSTRTKPMGERIRNALFNSLGDSVRGAQVLDVFAGTGAVGIEALSRGAAHCTFVERDRVAQKILAKNIASLQLDPSEVTVAKRAVAGWIDDYPPDAPLFDIIFADPPYHDLQLSTVSRLFDLLKPNGLMVLSHTGRCEAPTKLGVVVVDNRSYGNACLTYYRREGDGQTSTQ